MKLYVKYMVSIRCKMVVKAALDELKVDYDTVDLGEVEVTEQLTAAQHKQLETKLLRSGLELIDDKKSILIEKVKTIIVEMIHYSEQPPPSNFSDYLSEKLKYDFKYLSHLFSEVKGITIEHYIIAHKIERIKELLLYDELNLTEISYQLNYNSVSHLSHQFKKVTGLTPTYFKKLKQHKRRITLEDV